MNGHKKYTNEKKFQSISSLTVHLDKCKCGDEQLCLQEGNEEPILPGILGGWREDLQGKQRPDSLVKPRDVFVKTKQGEVQGFKMYLYDNPDPASPYRPTTEFFEQELGSTTVFLGIPYAMPPVDEGRFKPPRWHKGFQLLQATDFGPACPQPIRYTGATKGVRDMHEDCLYLNIFTPHTGGVPQNYPVMVYIHGGDFVRGASNTFLGHIMATFYKVVVVTLNYRLGALGSISLKCAQFYSTTTNLCFKDS